MTNGEMWHAKSAYKTRVFISVVWAITVLYHSTTLYGIVYRRANRYSQLQEHRDRSETKDKRGLGS